MGYVIKGLLLLLVMGDFVVKAAIEPLAVLGLLLVIALWVFREKHLNSPALIIPEYVLIVALSYYNPVTLVLCCAHAYDLPATGLTWFPALLLPGGLFFLRAEQAIFFSVLIIICSLAGYLSYLLKEKDKSFQNVYDRERRNRYALEEAGVKLMHSAREAAHLAEIRERNRIARDIHDHVGHHLSAILLQLQVVRRMLDKDPIKAHDLLDQSITGLGESVELLRDTVHNIKPVETLGIDYIKKIIENFKYCQVEFTHSGDFAAITADYTDIISSILREALNNVNRHSSATLVSVKIDVLERIVRLHIQDNGRGSTNLREGMGLRNMKERARDAGGSITVDPGNGFSIVCILPRLDREGVNVIESSRG